ncbi:MAG: DUF2142 domain-containing protein [Gammaproteobacteria bacterium]
MPVERLFVVIALVFGPLFIILTPPFQNPDEYGHFYRIYQLSEGTLFADLWAKTKAGGELPAALEDAAQPFLYLPYHQENKTSSSAIVNVMRTISIDRDQRRFMHFPNAAINSPLVYGPQVVGMWLVKPWTSKALIYLYAGRLANLLVWTLSLYWIIRWSPRLRWFLCLIGLTPMSLALAGSLGADAMTMVYVSLWVVLIMRCLEGDSARMTLACAAMLLGAGLALALAKFAFIPLIGLLVLLWRRDGYSGQGFLYGLVIGLMCGAVWLWWAYSVMPLLVLNNDSLVMDIDAQIAALQAHPFAFVGQVLDTLQHFGKIYWDQFYGRLGWLDTPLPRAQKWFYLGVLIVTLFEGDGKESVMAPVERAVLALAVALAVLAIYAALFIQWNLPGNSYIMGVQGRYFIPLALPLAWALRPRPGWLLPMPRAAALLVGLGLTAIHGRVVGSLIERYYGW